MNCWKEKVQWEKRKRWYMAIGLLLAIVVYQQFLIADLQERMMYIEASKYDDQLNDIR